MAQTVVRSVKVGALPSEVIKSGIANIYHEYTTPVFLVVRLGANKRTQIRSARQLGYRSLINWL